MTTITLVDNGTRRYAQVTTNKVLGRMYDNISEQITVVKPASESGRVCTMIVTGTQSGCYQAKTIDEITVGDDAINISNAISQYAEVKIGFSFSDDTGYVKNSEVETYTFLPAQKPNDWKPETTEMQYNLNQILGKGFVDVSWKSGTNNTLVFKNLNGDVVDEIDLGSFVQEQSNLAETDSTKETFVKNKSTKYLTNEGEDGSSPYATQEYVKENGGKIDTISVNGVQQVIVNKNVDITVPTNTVASDVDVSVSEDDVSLNVSTVNLGTQTTSTTVHNVPLASDTAAGMMASADYNQIRDNTSRIENLEAKTTRILYSSTTLDSDISISSDTTLEIGSRLAIGSILNGTILSEIKEISEITTMAEGDLVASGSVVANGSIINQITFPRQSDIQSYVDSLGYTEPYAGIAVVDSGNYHIWHYYQNGGIGWRDDGQDTVSQFTNTIAGVVKGTTRDGGVYAETDGTGSVYGWSALKTRVTNLENSEIAKVMLVYDGTNITRDGVVQTFTDIKNLVNNTTSIVEVTATNFNVVMRYDAFEDDAIWFNSRYKINGTNYLNRLIINSDNEIIFDDDAVLTQYMTMPEPSEALSGAKVQYIGATNTQYTSGYFYKCGLSVEAVDESLNVLQTSGYDLGTISVDKDTYLSGIAAKGYDHGITEEDSVEFEFRGYPEAIRCAENGSEVVLSRDSAEDVSDTDHPYAWTLENGTTVFTDTKFPDSTTYFFGTNDYTDRTDLEFVSVVSYNETTDGYWSCNNDWYDESNILEYNIVNLADFGVTYTGTATVGDKFVVKYTARVEAGTDYVWSQMNVQDGVDITTEISESSTDSEVPSAKAVYDYVQANITTVLTTEV